MGSRAYAGGIKFADWRKAVGTEIMALYCIEDFTLEPGRGACGYGPSIVLAGAVAEELIKSPVKLDRSNAVYIAMLDCLQRFVPKEYRKHVGLDFYEDTWLLASINLGGGTDRPSCGLMGQTRSNLSKGVFENIKYRPFNIDHYDLSIAALLTWELWIHKVVRLTSIELPRVSALDN